VIIVIANIKDPDQKSLGEELYKKLLIEGIDVLLDDRDERAGIKFKDADLIGIPWRVVVGRDAAAAQVELIERSSKSKNLLEVDSALEKLLKEISEKKKFSTPLSL